MANRKLHLEFGRRCNQDEMDSLLQDINDYLDRTAGEKRRCFVTASLALRDCIDAAGSDREAELMRAGYRLGVCLSMYEEEATARYIQKQNQRKGISIKLDKSSRRDKALVQDYQVLASMYGCLGARKRLAIKNKRTLTRINQILKKHGIEINRKS